MNPRHKTWRQWVVILATMVWIALILDRVYVHFHPRWVLMGVVVSTGFVVVTMVGAKFVKRVVEELDKEQALVKEETGLEQAGYWIGIGERALVYIRSCSSTPRPPPVSPQS